jgi:hypothetical protein
MPRPRTEQADFWAWEWEKSGMFTVRSTYREIVLREGLPEPSGSSSDGDANTWKSLWGLQVMPKIRVFWWRVVKNMLPCASELHRRHIKDLSGCPLCGHVEESLYHALIDCEHAKSFWRVAQEFFELKLPRLHPHTWSKDILDREIVSKKDAAVAVSVMWTIWGSRNSYNHGEVKYQPLRSIELVDELIKAIDIPLPGPVARTVPEVQKWKRPEESWLKLNCDGALNFQEKVAGTGVIVRDHTGGFVVAECRKYSHIVDPGMVELLACRDAVWLAKARGWSHVVVETDCQLIVKEWNEGKVQRSASTLIMREMKATISDFQGFKFCFAKRISLHMFVPVRPSPLIL